MARLATLKSVDIVLNEAKVFHSYEACLSARERAILSWVALGKSSRETAIIMGISEHTVNEHVGYAVTKLDASNRTEAVLRAVLLNEIDL